MAGSGNGRTSRPYTQVDFTDFAHIGPGALASEYMRRFWHPVIRTEDLLPGRALPIRILGEDLTLYRGEGASPHPARLQSQAAPASPIAMGEGGPQSGLRASRQRGNRRGESGKPHLLAFRCAHRGTQLSTGWVEGEDLRCFYHGWKYDPSGQCIEQPAEPDPFCEKIRIRAYPAEDYLGLVFVYLGASRALDPSGSRPQPVSPPDREGEPPPLPRYPEFEGGSGVREVIQSEVQPANFFNRIEKAVDPVHGSFTHPQLGRTILTIEATETAYGIEVRGTRTNGETWVNHYHMPNVQQARPIRFREPGARQPTMVDLLQWRIPIDDQHYQSFVVRLLHLGKDAAKRYLDRRRPDPVELNRRIVTWAEAVLAGAMSMQDMIDTVGDHHVVIAVQEYVTVVGQGVTADRANEHLGASDVAITLLREIWERELRALAEGRPLTKWRRPDRLVAVSS